MLMFSPYQKILIDILREKIGEKYQTGVECKKNEHTAFFGTLNTTIVRAAGRRKSAQAPMAGRHQGAKQGSREGLWISLPPLWAKRTVNHALRTVNNRRSTVNDALRTVNDGDQQ